MHPILIIVLAILGVIAIPFLVYGAFKAVSVFFKLFFTIIGNIFRFIGATVSDLLRFVGATLAAIMFVPLIILSIVVGRWSRSRHYAVACQTELQAMGACVWRLVIGNPARLFGLGSALEGLEQRVPEAIAAAPTSDKPSKKRVGMFDHYTIVGSLKGGGSGGKLYIAEPDDLKQAAFTKRGLDVDQVVIKVFSLADGSSLPQIVRESRALDAARNLGLVLEHELTKDRFFYVMRYVPGEPLSAVTTRLHATSPSQGLTDTNLREALSYMDDLLSALMTYHSAGLWHKDVKPDNIIVDPKAEGARAHLVDFGLITPLRSAMTLTTHGTEYFRDPELVRQALRGVKVHQIDGTRFDVYAAGAVLFSIIENSFPAHAGLSQISKRCPESLRWIVRRAMTDYDKRYPSAAMMLADLRVVLGAKDPFAVKPAQLPSVSQSPEDIDIPVPEPLPDLDPSFVASAQRAATPAPKAPHSPDPTRQRVQRPKLNVKDWWTGRYDTPKGTPRAPVAPVPPPPPAPRVTPIDQRKPAKEQLKNARARAQAMQDRANRRRADHRANHNRYKNDPHPLVIVLTLAVIGTLIAAVVAWRNNAAKTVSHYAEAQSETESFWNERYQDFDPNNPESPEPFDHVNANILLVDDTSARLDAPSLEALNNRLQYLKNQGINVFDSNSEESTIELLASYRNAIGAIPYDSADMIIRTRDWLGTHDSVDAILILSPEPKAEHDEAILIASHFNSRFPMNDNAPHLMFNMFRRAAEIADN